MRYGDWQHVRSVLVVRTDAVRDVIMLGPALRALKGALPHATVTLLASSAGAEVAPLLPWVDEVIRADAVWEDNGGEPSPGPGPGVDLEAEPKIDVEAQVDLIEAIEGCRADAAFVFTDYRTTPWPAAYLCYLAGVPIRIGQSKELGGALLTRWVRPQPDRLHSVDRNLFLLEQAGLPVAGRQLELHVPDPARASTAELLHGLGVPPGEPFVVLAPGTGPAARFDPVAEYAELAEALAGRLGLPIVLVGGRADVGLGNGVVAAAPDAGVVSVAGQTSVAELAAVVERAEVIVTDDADTMFVGDAFRCPMVVLVDGPDLEARTRPRGAAISVLHASTAADVIADEAVALVERTPRRIGPLPPGALTARPSRPRPAAGPPVEPPA